MAYQPNPNNYQDSSSLVAICPPNYYLHPIWSECVPRCEANQQPVKYRDGASSITIEGRVYRVGFYRCQDQLPPEAKKVDTIETTSKPAKLPEYPSSNSKGFPWWLLALIAWGISQNE